VLDDVERRRFLVQPARKDPLPPPLRAAHAKLHESAGQLLDLPGRRRLAGPQAHGRVADPDRLARPQGEIARDAVALVEEAEDGDPLGHGRGAGRDGRHGLGDVDGAGLARRLALGAGSDVRAAIAAGQRGKSE
jgi:hypothetical protein